MHTCICNLDCFGSQYLCMYLAGPANSIHMFECGPYSRSGETPLLVIWSPVSPVAPCNFFHLIAFSQSPVFRDWTYSCYLLRMCNFQLLFLHIRGSSARIPERFPYRAGLPSDWWLRHLLWNCPNMNVTGLHWWSVYIGSANGLVQSGNKPLPEPMLTQISVAIWRHWATMS